RVALDSAELAIKWWPENFQPYVARGWIRQVNDQVDLAIRDYDDAIRLNPNYAMAYNFRGGGIQRQIPVRPRHSRFRPSNRTRSEVCERLRQPRRCLPKKGRVRPRASRL